LAKRRKSKYNLNSVVFILSNKGKAMKYHPCIGGDTRDPKKKNENQELEEKQES
jgi:hypothetical protein